MKNLTPVLIVISSLLTACGSDSPDKSNKVAEPKALAPTQANGHSRNLAESATFGVVQAKIVREATALFPFAYKITDPNININDLPKNPKFDEVYPPSNCSNEDGKFEIGGLVGATGSVFIYDNCNVGEDTTLTGMILISYGSSFKHPEKHVLGHLDLTIKKDDRVDYIEIIAIECPRDISDKEPPFQNMDNCTYTSDYKAINGIRYRLAKPVMQGSDSQGYRIETKVIDKTYGKMNITSSGLLFNCDNGLPSSGSIDYSTKAYSANITFPNCGEYTLTKDGVSQTYSWSLGPKPK